MYYLELTEERNIRNKDRLLQMRVNLFKVVRNIALQYFKISVVLHMSLREGNKNGCFATSVQAAPRG